MARFRVGSIVRAELEKVSKVHQDLVIEKEITNPAKIRLGGKDVEFTVEASDDALLDLIKKSGAAVQQCTQPTL